jgi:hypothetical protein
LAEIAQAQHDPKSTRQGWGSFAKRYGASFADQTDENMMTETVTPALLREDSRYFRLGSGSFFKRTTYAMSRIWVTRTDAGGTTFNSQKLRALEPRRRSRTSTIRQKTGISRR